MRRRYTPTYEPRTAQPAPYENALLITHAWDAEDRNVADDIRTLWHILLSNLRIIVVTVAAVLFLVMAYIWTTTPMFSSRVEILIDPRQRNSVGTEVLPSGLGSSAAGADTLLLESQLEVLRSRKVADELIASENLSADSEYAGGGSAGLSGVVKGLIKSVIYGPQTAHWQRLTPHDQALKTLADNMSVARERNTYVISVSLESEEAAKAAHLANRVAEIYIAGVNSAASGSTREMASYLSDKLDELKTNANEAARKVEAYRAEHGLIDTNQTLIVEQRLSDLNRELSQAQLRLQSIETLRNQVITASPNDNSLALRLSEFGETTVMADLQSRLSVLASREAELSSTYLPGHPALKRLQQNKAALQTSIRQEQSRIRDRLNLMYNTARDNAERTQAEVGRLEARMAATNSSSVELRELQREAETSKNVYENYLQRSKEAWEQVDLPSSTAQIISPAAVASRPSNPQVLKLLMAGVGFGAVLGVGLAFLRHTLSQRGLPDEPRPYPERRSRPIHRPGSGPLPSPTRRPSEALPRRRSRARYLPDESNDDRYLDAEPEGRDAQTGRWKTVGQTRGSRRVAPANFAD